MQGMTTLCYCPQNKPPVFAPDGQTYFWVLPQRHSTAGFFQNVARVQIVSTELGLLIVVCWLTIFSVS